MTINLLGALATAFVICAVTGPSFISVLHKLNFGQSIRECGPKEHMKKSGTPTMGGIMMLLAILVAVAVWCNFTPALCIALLLTFGHALLALLLHRSFLCSLYWQGRMFIILKPMYSLI